MNSHFAYSFGPILALSLGSAAAAQEENVSVSVHHVIDGWRGDLWQKGDQFRCTTKRHVSVEGRVRRDIDRTACTQAIECYRGHSGRMKEALIPPSRWTRVNKDQAVFFVQGECAFQRNTQ